MYQVYCNDELIYDIRDRELTLINPIVELEDNSSGSFEFVMPPGHPYYEKFNVLVDTITVLQDENELFVGRVLSCEKDFKNRLHVYCEGELAYLLDSIQEVAEYHDMTIRAYLETLIQKHNEQVEQGKQFKVGAVTVTNSTDNVYRYSNYENTLEAIKEKLVNRLGGHLSVRKENGVRYLDYLESFARTSRQKIEFGSNLLDFSCNMDAGDIATCLIPLGAKIEDGEMIGNIEERITVESVNNGSNRIYAEEAQKIYGTITRVVTWDDVHIPANLLQKGRDYLQDIQFENMTLECRAIDLNLSDKAIESFRIGDNIQISSKPHGLERLFPLSKLKIQLDQPKQCQLTLGAEYKRGFVDKSSEQDQEVLDKIAQLPSGRSILDEAIRNTTDIINRFQNEGHVIYGQSEISIMDIDDIDLAQHVWRWNLGGLAFSSNGYYGPFDKLALTMDGYIMGQRIMAGSIEADSLSVAYRQSVDTSVSNAYKNALSDAIADTDVKLKAYYTSYETETRLSVTADEVKAEASKNLTVFAELIWDAMDESEVELKGYIDESIKYFVTVAEMDAALTVQSQNINAYVSANYTTYAYTDQKYNEAVTAAKNHTTSALEDYVTTVALKAQLQILSNEISLSVSESYVTKSNFNTSVSNLEASIKLNATNIAMKVSEGNVSSQLSIEPGSVSIKSNRLIVESTNFKLSGTGQVTSSGAFTSVSGNNQSQLTGGRLYFYYGGTRIGDITASAGASGGTGTVLGIGGDQRGIIMALSNTYYYVLNGGFNPGGRTERHVWSGAARFNDTVYGVNTYFERTYFNTATYSSSINAGLYGGINSLSINTGAFVYGNFGVQGTKNRIVETNDYGHIAMNALESTGAFFADFGSGIIPEDGVLHVILEPKFLQTIDDMHQYIIQYSKIGPGAITRIVKKPRHFIIYGEAGTELDWSIYAKQKGYASTRMDHMSISGGNDTGAAQRLYDNVEQRRQDIVGRFNVMRSEREKEIDDYVLYPN